MFYGGSPVRRFFVERPMVEPLMVSVCGLMIGSLCNIIIYWLQAGEAMIRPDSHYHLCFAPP